MPNAKGEAGKESRDFEAHGKDADATERLDKITQEIVNLYLKIKRCSKDVNITESQYLEQVETAEDREERLLIAKMDPMIVLQYINVSIDVIINLKFEDIENKMAESAVKRMDHDKKNGSRPQRNDRSKKRAAREKQMAGDSLANASDNERRERRGDQDAAENQEIEVANQLEDLVVEDTPQ